MAPPELIEALPDLTLSEAGERWGVRSPNALKGRARALGVELHRDSPTRTVCPAADIPLGDRLAEHLAKPGATLANFPEAAPAAPAAGAGSDGSALAALAQLAAAMNPAPPADPLAVARGLSDAAALGPWLTPAELTRLLGMAPGTVRNWSSGHQHRPGFELERRKDGASVWWKGGRQ